MAGKEFQGEVRASGKAIAQVSANRNGGKSGGGPKTANTPVQGEVHPSGKPISQVNANRKGGK